MTDLMKYEVIGVTLTAIEREAFAAGVSAMAVCSAIARETPDERRTTVGLDGKPALIVSDYRCVSAPQLAEISVRVSETHPAVGRAIDAIGRLLEAADVATAFIPVASSGVVPGAIAQVPVFARTAPSAQPFTCADAKVSAAPDLDAWRRGYEACAALGKRHAVGVALALGRAARDLGFQTVREALLDEGVLGRVAARVFAGLIWAAAAFARGAIGATTDSALLQDIAGAIAGECVRRIGLPEHESVVVAILSFPWVDEGNHGHSKVLFNALSAKPADVGGAFPSPTPAALENAVAAALAMEMAGRRERLMWEESGVSEPRVTKSLCEALRRAAGE